MAARSGRSPAAAGPDSHLYTPVTLNGATMTGGLTSNIFRFHRDVAVQASLNSSVLSVAQFSLEPVLRVRTRERSPIPGPSLSMWPMARGRWI
jgi:hypothetical protein